MIHAFEDHGKREEEKERMRDKRKSTRWNRKKDEVEQRRRSEGRGG